MFVPYREDELTVKRDNDYSFYQKHGDKKLFTEDELLDAILEYCNGDIEEFRKVVIFLAQTLRNIEITKP